MTDRGSGRITGLLALSLSLIGLPAIAQTTTHQGGSQAVERGVFRFTSGPMQNNSGIPLLVDPHSGAEGQGQAVDTSKLAPATFTIEVDSQQVRDAVGEQGLTDLQYEVTNEVRRSPGNHSFAEGIEANGEAVFVRGDGVEEFQGEALPEFASVTSAFGEGDAVNVRVLNLRTNNSEPSDSGVVFLEDGSRIVEDSTDNDFNDGDFLSAPTGSGEGVVINEAESVEVVTEKASWNTEPFGMSPLLPHLDESGEPTGSYRIGVDSDGFINFTGQLLPIGSSDRPLLLNYSARIQPTAADNSELFNLSAGFNQFLTPTHRTAVDEDVIAIALPEGAGPGDSAYTNVGGLIATYEDGEVFIPQWGGRSRPR